MKNDDIKIAYLADGNSVHTKRWLDYFSSRDYEVHLITYKRTRIENVKVHKVATAKIKIPFRVIQTIKLIRKIKPDILHAFYITNNGAIGALSGFHPLVLSAWGSDISVDPEKYRILRFLVTSALKRADLIHTGDEVGRKRLMDLGCDAEKIFVQPSGVDTNLFSPEARSPSLRKRLGIDSCYSVILARWWKNKYSVDVFIRAVPLVLKEIPDVKFILLGGGPLESGLKALARKLGVYENVSFIGGIPHELMPEYLASVDLYVDTSSEYRPSSLGKYLVVHGGGGMGVTTAEALACGTPQILPDKRNVRSGRWFQGLMYKQLNYQDLAEKIVGLLNDEKLRKKIGNRSRKISLQICSLQKNMKKWEDIYRKICSEKNRGIKNN